MSTASPVRRLLTAAAFVLSAAPVAGQASTDNPCGGLRTCQAARDFTTTITDFRPSLSGRNRVIAITARFRNLTNRPLYLGYVSESGLITDDQGNRYLVYQPTVRGIGTVSANSFDPKFVLRPGESSDARFELSFAPGGNTIHGTTFILDLAVREIDPLPGDQFRLGREHTFQWRGFPGVMSTPAVADAPAQVASATPSAPAEAAPPPPEPVDLCANKSQCFHTGPFLAEVTNVVGSRVSNRYHYLTLTVRFRNVSTEPIILGYQAGSSTVVDDLGNPYYWGTRGTADASVKGMGLVTGRSADPQFVLRPGQTRQATFTLRRNAGPQTPIAETYTQNFVVLELEILPSRQVRTVREHAVGLQDVKLGVAAKGKSLLDAIGKAIKKP